ncbi:MAG: serine/threonine-protein kinase, partial [Acidobacteriota bacterium]
VHRDLKPANILIDASGRPKLLDFGIAKLLAPGDVAGADLTSLGVSPMTLRYASPEQVRGEPATVLFDVYALGVLLYRLLTGGFPHDGETDAEITDRIRDDEPTRPSQRLRSAPTEEQETVAAGRGMTREALGRRLDGDLDAILVKALARRPEDRYSSVDRFADDVRRHLDERPIEARPPSLAYRTGRFVQRNTALTALIAVTFGALVGTTGLVLSRAAVQREALAAATIGDRLRELLSDVLSDADPTRTDGADLTASEILDRVVEQAAETESLEERDWLYREIAKIYLQREEGEEALVLQERAAALDLDRSPVDRAWLTSNLCRSLQLLGRNQEAEGLCREAIEVLDGHPTIEPAEVAPVLNNLALALYGRRSQEQAAEAEAIFRRSLAMKRAGGEPEWGDSIVVTRMNLARVMAYQRKLSEAQETFDELLAISEVEEFRRGQILANAGANLVRLTQFDAAETRFLEALAISDKIFGKTSDTSAARYTNLAMVSNLQGESSEAEERARSGLAIYEQQMATADRDGEPLDFPHETFGALNEQLACSFRDPSLANLARDHFEIAQEAYGSVSLSGKIQRVDRHLESLQAATDGETLPPCDFGFSKAR